MRRRIRTKNKINNLMLNSHIYIYNMNIIVYCQFYNKLNNNNNIDIICNTITNNLVNTMQIGTIYY